MFTSEPLFPIAILGMFVCSVLAYGLGFYRGKIWAYRQIDEVLNDAET